ncbi:MAG TPA: PIG-L deacetylase family protein [Ramlibacter sp.]|nr:PIG-L deacetylase family protein [Ramlibacter sp.]
MSPLNLLRQSDRPLSVLCLGAHADDIEIGCGGTLLQLLDSNPKVCVTWVVFSSAGEREREARESASRFLRQAAQHRVVVMKFRDGYFPYQGAEIKDAIETLKKEVDDPDLVFTHYRQDRHQDHRTLSDLTWNTWRRHMILEYEIPKYDGDLGAPNCFVPLSRDTGERKARHICEAFQSEGHKDWMSEDTFMALLRLRGVECAAPQGLAEAFHCRKLVLDLGH